MRRGARATSPRLLQLSKDHGYVARVDRADMLITDDPAPIDDEAFRHAGRAERDLNAALRIASDPLIRIAVAREEIAEIAGRVTNGDAVDCHGPGLELLQHAHFG